MPLQKKHSEKVADDIKRLITENGMNPGAMLPTIDKLSKDFNVSIGTIREALMRLAAMGIIEIHQGKGTFIAEQNFVDIFRSVSWHPLINELTVSEVIKARAAVEAMTAQLAAENAGSEQIESLFVINLKMEIALQNQNYEDFITLDGEFHDMIARASRNRLLAGLTTVLREFLLFAIEEGYYKKYMQLSFEFHKQITKAIKESEPIQARMLMVNHLEKLDRKKLDQDIEIYCDGLGTGSAGGSFYTLGQYIARSIARSTWIKPVVFTTGGGIDNVRLIQNKSIALSITQADTAHEAFYGKGDFKTPCPDLRVLCCLPGLGLQISTLSTSKIEKLDELKDRRIAIGAYGGASVYVSKEVLRHIGLEAHRDYIPHIVNFATAVDMMNNQVVDAVCFLSAGPSSALIELSCRKKLRFLSLSRQLITKLVDTHPFWYSYKLESNTYPEQESIVQTIGTPVVLITHKDLPDSDAYVITSVILKQIDQIGALTFSPFSVKGAAANIGIPHHPGAIKYLEEKISWKRSGY